MQPTFVHREIVETEERLVAALRAALERAHARHTAASLPDKRVPCFAHLRVRTQERGRDLLLGSHTLIDADGEVSLIDWRKAPLAEVFFTHDEGETYELEVDGRPVKGTVVHKRLLAFTDGQLSRIEAGNLVLERQGEAGWRSYEEPRTELSTAGKSSLPRHRVTLDETGRRVPVVGDLLDAEQRALLDHHPERPLLILGGAGCGKTTVALHRLARLHHTQPRRFDQRHMAVVVPELGLQRLTAAILEQLGLPKVGVFTFDAWVAKQARRVFADLPRREYDDTPAAVVKLKRHPALRAVLPWAVDKLAQALSRRLQQRVTGTNVEIRLGVGPPSLLAQLDALEEQLLHQCPARLRDTIARTVASERRRLFAARDELLLLFGDRDLLMEAVSRSEGELTENIVSRTLEHTRLQFSATAEQLYAHVDEERRQAVDGRGLDEGTPNEAAQTVDPEDYAICFELLRLKTGGVKTPHGRPELYNHLVLDEAQDLAPIELGVLGQSLKSGASLTVCGDQAQHIDPSACFAGWEGALAELGVSNVAPAHLQTSYRCTEAVTSFAHAVLGPLAPQQPPRALRRGAEVLRNFCPTRTHAIYRMSQALAELLREHPGTSVAIITRSAEGARSTYEELVRVLPVRLVLSGLFSFAAGVDITPVSQVKGLEFDVVVVPDANSDTYPDVDDARRKLHVACTRAIEQLWVISVGKPSPLLPVAEAKTELAPS